MRMSEDDDAGSGKFAAGVAAIVFALAGDMYQANLAAANHQRPLERQRQHDLLLLDVAPRRLDGRIGAELVQHRQRREVARVQNQLDILKMSQYRVRQARATLGDVRIRENADTVNFAHNLCSPVVQAGELAPQRYVSCWNAHRDRKGLNTNSLMK